MFQVCSGSWDCSLKIWNIPEELNMEGDTVYNKKRKLDEASKSSEAQEIEVKFCISHYKMFAPRSICDCLKHFSNRWVQPALWRDTHNVFQLSVGVNEMQLCLLHGITPSVVGM